MCFVGRLHFVDDDFTIFKTNTNPVIHGARKIFTFAIPTDIQTHNIIIIIGVVMSWWCAIYAFIRFGLGAFWWRLALGCCLASFYTRLICSALFCWLPLRKVDCKLAQTCARIRNVIGCDAHIRVACGWPRVECVLLLFFCFGLWFMRGRAYPKRVSTIYHFRDVWILLSYIHIWWLNV